MPLIGLPRDNPRGTTFDKELLNIFTPPIYAYFTDANKELYDKLVVMALSRVRKSVFGAEWELAMCLAIGHFVASREKLADVSNAGGDLGVSTGASGTVTSYTVGSVSKSMDLSATHDTNPAAFFWNTTSYGSMFWQMLLSKSILTMGLVV